MTRTRFRLRAAGAGLAWALAVVAVPRAGHAKTAEQFLSEIEKPRFRPDHTLLRLTRWGWSMPFNVRVQLCEDWGYGLEFGGYATTSVVANVWKTNTTEYRLCSLTASNPARYPLSVLLHRPFTDAKFVAALPEATWCHDAGGSLITNVAQWQRYSPEMPDANYQLAGALSAAPLATITQRCPIDIVLNGGEYGLSVYGHSGSTWAQDPAVQSARGSQTWLDYISARKNHHELFVSSAVRAVVPGRSLYIFYYTDGAPHRRYSSTWWQWVWDYPFYRTISDRPNSSIYYKDFNTGWTGSQDMLSCALSSAAQQIAAGDPLSYNWVCGGYKTNALAISDEAHYVGFLKCWYTAGMVGGVAGYFTYPPGGFAADLGTNMPSWLAQMTDLGHVHALFSHLEDYLRNGDLLPGPDMHRWSTDLPAYEFPTGDADARVVVRRHRTRAEWLVAAWAAGGADRVVSVSVPELGTVAVEARACGSVYLATAGVAPVRLDPDGLAPSRQLAMDYGDAPESYRTSLNADGARHRVVAGFRLGALVDADLGGRPDSSAGGDDRDAGPDEDGVRFLDPLVAGATSRVEVAASTNGWLSAWVDFDRNGDWGAGAERVASNATLVAGVQIIPVRVPTNAVRGASFARFRFSSQAGLGPAGAAPDGEVEDYRVALRAPVELTGAAVSASGTAALGWVGAPPQYTVERSTSLTAGGWAPVDGVSWPLGTSAWSGLELPAAGAIYFRVRGE